MMKMLFFLFACFGLLPRFLGATIPIPDLRDPVTDEAGVLSPDTRAQLNDELRRLWQTGGSQLSVLTIPSLEGEAIEAYSIRVADRWKLGDKRKDNGILFLIAVNDRESRIEVGQGLEGALPDVVSSRIIRQAVTPRFKEGNFDAGVVSGVASILGRSDPDFQLGDKIQQAAGSIDNGREPGPNSAPLVFILVVLAILARFFLRALPGSRYRHTNYWGSGGFGRSGGRSGGFGGGGGGFSGGGASGRW